MAAKIMVFIDGTWLYSNQKSLANTYGGEFQIDYGKLPKVLGQKIGENLGSPDVDIVRTYLFGSNAKNYLPIDHELVAKRKDFFDILKEEYHYEVEVYDIDFRKKRLKKKDRDPSDDFSPEEKCVDIALASSMLYYAALPYAYDIAILVAGDRDFVPVLRKVRRLGKRVGIASITKSCPTEFRDVKDELGLRDFDVIWLDELLTDIQLTLRKQRVECKSPFHKGENPVYTDEFIRKGRPYYCKPCRDEFNRLKSEYVDDTYVPEELTVAAENDSYGLATGEAYSGTIKRMMQSFAFISTPEGDFYFDINDCSPGTDFYNLREGDKVRFLIAKLPNRNLPGTRGNGNAEEVEVMN